MYEWFEFLNKYSTDSNHIISNVLDVSEIKWNMATTKTTTTTTKTSNNLEKSLSHDQNFSKNWKTYNYNMYIIIYIFTSCL